MSSGPSAVWVNQGCPRAPACGDSPAGRARTSGSASLRISSASRRCDGQSGSAARHPGPANQEATSAVNSGQSLPLAAIAKRVCMPSSPPVRADAMRGGACKGIARPRAAGAVSGAGGGVTRRCRCQAKRANLPDRSAGRDLRGQAGLHPLRRHLTRERGASGLCLHLLTILPGQRAPAPTCIPPTRPRSMRFRARPRCGGGDRLQHHPVLREGRDALYSSGHAASAGQSVRIARPRRSSRVPIRTSRRWVLLPRAGAAGGGAITQPRPSVAGAPGSADQDRQGRRRCRRGSRGSRCGPRAAPRRRR